MNKTDQTISLAKKTETLEVQEKELRKNKQLLHQEKNMAQKCLDIAGVMFVAMNAKGEITLINRRGSEILGYQHDEIIGKNWFDHFVPEKERTRVKAVFGQLMRGEIQAVEYYENTVINHRGETKIIAWHNTISRDDQGQIIGTLSSGEDITERRQAEEGLRLSDQKLRMALEASHMGTWDWDVAANRVNWSAETRKIFRIGAGNFGGTYEAYLAFTPPEVREKIDRRIKAFLKYPPKSGVIHYDHPIVTGDGQARWIEVRGTLFKDNQGRLTLMTGVCTDITDKKHEEAEKKRLQEQFHQAQKLESVGRLAGGVAHDLNNLLSPILGYGEMLLAQAGAHGRQKEPLEEILNAGLRARDLVRQLLAFSRKQTLDFTRIDLNALLSNFEKLLRRTIREDVMIQMNLAQSLPPVKGDRGQLEQVVMNLAVNAQDAMPHGGKLVIETGLVELDKTYATEHEGAAPAPHVMLLVSDTGCGMDEETRDLIFEPFFTTKEVDQGTGLGLATVYGIVKQHDGNIWVYSEPDMGTIFKIYLPVTDEPSESGEKDSISSPDFSGSETILLVEDNDSVRNLTLALLKREGYTVLTAENGKAALDLLNHYNGPLHLLLTDVIMPEMNGKQLYQHAKSVFPGIRVLYMSGYANDVIAHHGIMETGIHFIQKPFSIQALATRVREVLDH